MTRDAVVMAERGRIRLAQARLEQKMPHAFVANKADTYCEKCWREESAPWHYGRQPGLAI